MRCKFLIQMSLLWAVSGWFSMPQAQTPSLQDVVESAKQSKARESAKALVDAFKPATPLPSGAATAPPINLPMPAVELEMAPVLRAIYGMNEKLEAEVIFNNKAYSLNAQEARANIGPWTYGLVFREGVLLLKKPLNATQSALLDTLVENGLERTIRCTKLKLTNANCIFLLANKASAESSSSTRPAQSMFLNTPVTLPLSSSGVLPPSLLNEKDAR